MDSAKLSIPTIPPIIEPYRYPATTVENITNSKPIGSVVYLWYIFETPPIIIRKVIAAAFIRILER